LVIAKSLSATSCSCFRDCISLCEVCPYFRICMHREYGNFSSDYISTWPSNMTAMCAMCAMPAAHHPQQGIWILFSIAFGSPHQRSTAPPPISRVSPFSIQYPSRRNWLTPQQTCGCPLPEHWLLFGRAVGSLHYSLWLPLSRAFGWFPPQKLPPFSRAVGSP
jgi:hypothetical protein